MTTLINEDLFPYLGKLKEEIGKRQEQYPSNSLYHEMHGLMTKVILAEENFQKDNSLASKPMLSFSGSGMPSVESLGPDLEAMCSLVGDNNPDNTDDNNGGEGSSDDHSEDYSLLNISKDYSSEEINMYVLENSLHKKVSEEEWDRVLATYNRDDLLRKQKFAISEVEGKFKLSLLEEFYMNGVDSYCKEHPVFIRSGEMLYHLIWGNLMEEPKGNFYVPNVDVVLRDNVNTQLVPFNQSALTHPPRSKKGLFDDLFFSYHFKPRNFRKISKPGIFGRREKLPKGYKKLVLSSLDVRVYTAHNILNSLSDIFDCDVHLMGVSDFQLDKYFSYENVVLKDDQNWPKKDDVNKLNCELVAEFSHGTRKIGSLENLLPHYCRGYDSNRYYHGYTKIKLYGDAFSDEEQYLTAQKKLKQKHILGKFKPR
jgi:hypothetical protein